MSSWGIKESDKLIKVFTNKSGRTSGYFITDKESFNDYNDQFPFDSMGNLGNISYDQNYLIMGFNSKTIQQCWVATDYELKIISNEIFHGYTDLSFTEDGFQRNVIDSIYKKGLMTDKIPFTLLPILLWGTQSIFFQ